ncbi:MAG: methylamine dehydrogenase (amicyanin) light chain [Sulfuritalea sp.]|nr:methylamine dehydrogenase (amicyanin) light chain [Sulfuritalea sp.]
MKWFDSFFEQKTRLAAQGISRRSALSRIGRVVIGAALVLPILPFDRVAKEAHAAKKPVDKRNDDTACEYWRYCALDGWLCTCCGGTISTCPPGTDVSKVTWVGTCHNPNDGRDYLISYNDCCGATSCGRCLCNFNEGERPGYRMGVHNDVNWCMANSNNNYHCTVAAVVGTAESPQGR